MRSIHIFLIASLLGTAHAETSTLPGSVGTVTSKDANTERYDRAVITIQSIKPTNNNSIGGLRNEKSIQSIRLRKIQFDGNSIFSDNTLLDQVLGFGSTNEGDDLCDCNIAEIHSFAEKVTNFYRYNGYLASQSLVPEQDITDGVLKIKIFEGRLDDVQVVASDQSVAKRVQSVLDTQLPIGKALTNANLERGIALASEISGHVVSAQLQAGARSGGTRLEVSADKSFDAYIASLVIDDYGSKSTGINRVTASLGMNSLFTLGDHAVLDLGTTNQSNNSSRYDLRYNRPVGADGWSIGGRAWRSEYSLGDVFEILGATGYSESIGIYASYALKRRDDNRIDIRFGLNKIKISDHNSLLSNTSNFRDAKVYWADIGGWFMDQKLNSDARTNWLLNLSSGYLTFENQLNQLADATTAGHYQLLSYQISREQSLGGGFSALANLRGQFSNHNLDAYHKFTLGGATAVRAYANGEIAGDEAAIATIELRHLIPFDMNGKASSLRTAIFYDKGWAKFNKNPLAANASKNTAVRAGYGLSIGASISRYADVQIYWAKASDGNNVSVSDGKSSRVGAQLVLSY